MGNLPTVVEIHKHYHNSPPPTNQQHLHNVSHKQNQLQGKHFSSSSPRHQHGPLAPLNTSQQAHIKPQQQLQSSQSMKIEKETNCYNFPSTNVMAEKRERSQQNPETLKKLKEITKLLQKKQQEMLKLKDPRKIDAVSEEIFNNFLHSLDSHKRFNSDKKKDKKRIAVIGQNSAGKSTIYNWIFGLNCKVGIDDTTQEISVVFENKEKRLEYVDSPGLNQTINVAGNDVIQLFYTLDCVFIASAVTFKKLKRCIRIMDRINPPRLFLLRTQCDKFPTKEEFEVAKTKDYKLLQQWGIKREILYISAMKPDDFKDNLRFKKIMMGAE